MATLTQRRVVPESDVVVELGAAPEASTVADRWSKPRVAVRPRRVGPARGPVHCSGSAGLSVHGSGLTRRGKLVVGLVWLVLVAFGAFLIARPAGEDAPVATDTVTVEPGDTLWALALDADPRGDPRVFVDTVLRLNSLSSAGDIRPGDTLVVPVDG